MESLDCKNICRVCLGHNAVANWNEIVLESCDVTYKDIYYKYTQLDMHEVDPYSQMLCKPCSNDLKTSHFLIIKALESDYILHQTYATDTQMLNENTETQEEFVSLKDDIKCEPKYEPTGFEVLFFKQHNEESSTDENNDDSKSTVITKTEILNENVQGERKRRISKKPKWVDNYILDDNTSKPLIPKRETTIKRRMSLSESPREELVKTQNKKLAKDCKRKKTDSFEHSSPFEEDINETETYTKNNETPDILTNIQNNKNSKIRQEYTDSQDNPSSDLNKKKKQYIYKNTYICSMCSKTYRDKTHLLRHEESHKEHRERSEVCPQCGLKFFFKSDLRLHLAIHNKNREKKYKCEYCDKAYYGRGSLNVHRREHLGKMLPCSICSKEYHRQVDLDRHNRVAHSEIPLYTGIKKAPKYVVYCKECDKTLSTSSWAAHQAAHLKKPLMRCSICDKDFFSRNTCTYHMDKIHNFKKREEYEQFIIYHKTNRMSHLLIKQYEILQTK